VPWKVVTTVRKSDKSYAVAVILSAIFGVLGIQHFYLGRIGLGLFDLGLSIVGVYYLINGQIWQAMIFLGADWIHTMIVTVQLFIGEFNDGNGDRVCYPGQKLKGFEE